MGNLIGVSRTPPHLADLLKVHDHLNISHKQPISPGSSGSSLNSLGSLSSSSSSSSSSTSAGARSRSGSLVSPKAAVQLSNTITTTTTPTVELFSSYLFMWRVYVDHKNRLTVQYDPVDLVQFKKFNSNDCYIVLHVINNSELYKQIQSNNSATIANSGSRSSNVDISLSQLHHYHHHHHQLLHQHLHSTLKTTSTTTHHTTSTSNSATAPLDDMTLRSFMSSAQSELTPRGLSCPAGVFSCDPISHIETEEISHDVYIWNGKNSDPLTKAFCIAKGFDFVKALKFSDSLPKQRNLENNNSINNLENNKYFWKLPNSTSLIIQRLFQNTNIDNNIDQPINNNSNNNNNNNINEFSNFGPLSNYFIDDLSPLLLDKSKFDNIKETQNQNQQLYNSFHLYKRIIKKNFPQLLNSTPQNLSISELLPNSASSNGNSNNTTHHNQPDFNGGSFLNNNINTTISNFSESFQKFLDLSQSTNNISQISNSIINISQPNKDSAIDDHSFPTIPKFNPRYEVLRKLSSHRIASTPQITINHSATTTTTITSNNSNSNNNHLNNINTFSGESMPIVINGNSTPLTIPINPVNIEINSSPMTTSTTSVSNQNNNTNSFNQQQTKITKTIPFIPKLPINKIKNIPVLDIPSVQSPPISGNDNNSNSNNTDTCIILETSKSIIINSNNNSNNTNSNNQLSSTQSTDQIKPNPIKRIVPLLNLSKQNSLSSIPIPQCLNQSNISISAAKQIKIPTIVTTSTSTTTTSSSTSPPQTPRSTSQVPQPLVLTQTQIIQLTQREQINYFEPLMNRITENLYLGSRIPASNFKLLKDNGITHIINCAGMVCTNHFPDDFIYKTLYISDGTSEDIWCLFYEIMDFIEDAAQNNGRVYVHCHQGISRSSAFVILYLMWKNDWDFKKALDYTKEIRYISNPNPGFTGQLIYWKKFSKTPNVSKSPKLYRMVQLLGNVIVPKQVNTISYLSLDSRCCFILMVQHCTYFWVGEHCVGSSGELFVEAARRSITRFQKYENSSSNIIEIKQGQEDQEFWDLLGGRGGIGFIEDYSKDISQTTTSSTQLVSDQSKSSTTTTTTTTINFINY